MPIENEVPKSRTEQYLRKMCNFAGATIPSEPHTRNEEYLNYLCENGGGTSDYSALSNYSRKLDG